MNSTSCPVCLNQKAKPLGDDGGGPKIDCPRCGKFKIGWVTDRFLGNIAPRQRANLSGWIRQNQNCVIVDHNIKDLLALPTPALEKKVEWLLQYLANVYSTQGETIELLENVSVELQAVTWALDHKELHFLMKDYLHDELGFLLLTTRSTNLGVDDFYKISPKGWAYLESLHEESPRKEIGFHVVQQTKS